MLRDVEELIAPALTHWNHPRFFAYFGITGSEPGILAELLIAAFNVNAMAWSTSPAATELEQVVARLARAAARPAARLARAHRGHGLDRDARRARGGARSCRPGGVVYASEHAHFSVEKAARILGLEFRAVPVDDEFRMRTDFPLDDAAAVVATVGTTSSTSVDPVPALADRCERGGRVAARRRRVRGLGGRLPRAPLVPRRLRPRRLDRRQPAQVAVHADRLLGALDAAARGAARGVRGARRLPRLVRGRDRPARLRAGARPPLPRAEALDGAALLRPRRPAGADPRARAARGALRGVGARRARLGDLRAAALLHRLLPARDAPTTTSSRAARPRRARSSSRRRSCAARA